VNDTPLPQFKVNLSTVARLVAPRRPLKRERKIVSVGVLPAAGTLQQVVLV
jgi:hypothetical protein